MLINIEKQDDGSIMVFLSCAVLAPIAQVWHYLSDDEGLAAWFPELAVGELAEGGHMLLNMLPEALVKMPIRRYKPERDLVFDWDEDLVSFYLEPINEQETRLLFTERLSHLNDHSARDVAGWSLCLKRLKRAAEGGVGEGAEPSFEALVADYRAQLSQWLSPV
ncbi:MAG: SRPBCC domain-containing protein [Neisseriaceae bacterium]|nr:SRPBCC domain-containing protein [Neisseriaceae bacterium]MBP6861905.1 SRPBCC domain-containing protein [Neisseriaceae bacterium]